MADQVHIFAVTVRNEVTGEVRVVEIRAEYGPDAQIQALQWIFHEEGWHKAVAMTPHVDDGA